ncbi:MAG: sarcosine oxidase subunit delta [Candidatus Competibacterales bacterium]
MFVITCPFCGAADVTEFSYGGDASRLRPAADASLEAWHDYVYLRSNPRGPHDEYWHHVAGCRQWLVVRRDTLTHQITAVAPAKGEELHP